MTIRRFGPETQRNYQRDVGRFATWLGRSPHTATAEDVRRFQIEQREAGVPAPTALPHPDRRATGSGTVDFPTPLGVRNFKRKPNGRSWPAIGDCGHFRQAIEGLLPSRSFAL
jgi:hypothetical protein